MFSVALIGPDGCGKSTISKRLLQDASIRSKRIYMGVDRDESNYALPTTHLIRWVKRRLLRERAPGGPRNTAIQDGEAGSNPARTLYQQIKAPFVFLNNAAEEWYRQLLTWYFIHAGYVVVFDRHFYADFYHYHVDGSDARWTSRLHGYMLEHLLPKPDLVIYLDAPAETLYARKREGTIALLEQRRRDYLDLQDKVPRFAVVDATQPPEAVFNDVQQLILQLLRDRQQ